MTEDEHIALIKVNLVEIAAGIVDLQAENARLRAEMAEAHAGLLQCADWFKGYGDGHAAKGDTDKAERNYSREAFARTILAKLEEPKL